MSAHRPTGQRGTYLAPGLVTADPHLRVDGGTVIRHKRPRKGCHRYPGIPRRVYVVVAGFVVGAVASLASAALPPHPPPGVPPAAGRYPLVQPTGIPAGIGAWGADPTLAPSTPQPARRSPATPTPSPAAVEATSVPTAPAPTPAPSDAPYIGTGEPPPPVVVTMPPPPPDMDPAPSTDPTAGCPGTDPPPKDRP